MSHPQRDKPSHRKHGAMDVRRCGAVERYDHEVVSLRRQSPQRGSHPHRNASCRVNDLGSWRPLTCVEGGGGRKKLAAPTIWLAIPNHCKPLLISGSFKLRTRILGVRSPVITIVRVAASHALQHNDKFPSSGPKCCTAAGHILIAIDKTCVDDNPCCAFSPRMHASSREPRLAYPHQRYMYRIPRRRLAFIDSTRSGTNGFETRSISNPFHKSPRRCVIWGWSTTREPHHSSTASSIILPRHGPPFVPARVQKLSQLPS